LVRDSFLLGGNQVNWVAKTRMLMLAATSFSSHVPESFLTIFMSLSLRAWPSE
jgi:hypothetical protein